MSATRPSPDATDGPALPPMGSLARSVALFQAFRVEQTDPDRFYSLLAADTVREIGRYGPLAGRSIVDVGGGPGYFADAFRAAGARYAGIDPDVGELSLRGDTPEGFLRASGLQLPLADGRLDLCISSNVLEHVPDPRRMASEMVRVVRPGGLVWLSWTTWLSPWGGHETAPWHFLGGRYAADRFAAKHGRRPKNDFGRSLFNCSAEEMVRWAKATQRAGTASVLDIRPRYHPAWAKWMARVPGLRETFCWNVVIVLRKT
ncbi:class I SAM-dependent methyltransferase [Spongisporangium articulatum]|uniref:Class I SAM-dependent methyltransferase n=1 Tax=Spongisporangium articulatum TaxID=3362603 RepID=A0ABW8ARF1_9ACTN